jgi:hypothetical protein
MKDFAKFFEEITIKGNDGIPGEGRDRNEPSYLSGVERKGREKIANIRDPRPLFAEIMQLLNKATSLSRGKEKELSDFAEKIIRDIYPNVLDNVDLDIKIVRSGTEINQFMQEQDKKKEEDSKKKKENQSQEEEEEEQSNKIVTSNDRNLKLEVDKRKLANAIMQGEAKNTKNIIAMPECKDGLKSILGNKNGEELHSTLLRITGIADKLDWIIPIEAKAQMMEMAPEGMAGCVSVDYKGCDNDTCKKSAEDILKSLEEGEEMENMGEEIGDLLSQGKPTIRARGVDFSMLLHEVVKGIYELIARAGLPQDETLGKNVMMNTSSFADEAEDFKYGPYIAADLRDFVNKNPNIDKYPNLREFVFGRLISLPADEFLDSIKNILMESPKGRKIVDDLLISIISELDEYEDSISDFDAKQKLGEFEDEDEDPSDFDEPVQDMSKGNKSKVENQDIDYSTWRQSDIQSEIDDALDNGDYEKVKMLSKYLKEGREIYLKEIERINESHRFHGRRRNS